MIKSLKLIGPFKEILTMKNLPLKGPLLDSSLEIFRDAGILIDKGEITDIAPFTKLENQAATEELFVEKGPESAVCLPGFVDAHTHICYAGSRAKDYAQRVSGKSYIEIGKSGGGILDTVSKTRAASIEQLEHFLAKRCDRHLSEGVTTCEVKSGYGLDVDTEIKILEAINKVDKFHHIDLVPTCLAAHVPSPEYPSSSEYLNHIVNRLLPLIKEKNLSRRVDIFVEQGAFSVQEARDYLLKAKNLGFEIVIHGDQFTTGGSLLAQELQAASVDHLEASMDDEIKILAPSDVIAIVLPGVSLGLGMKFAPARKILDAGISLAIASDWNPGSAPMGDLLLSAAVLGAAENLSMAETFAGITFRAARVLNLHDRGILEKGKLADLLAFPCEDYREILYQQGKLHPCCVWKNGRRVI